MQAHSSDKRLSGSRHHSQHEKGNARHAATHLSKAALVETTPPTKWCRPEISSLARQAPSCRVRFFLEVLTVLKRISLSAPQPLEGEMTNADSEPVFTHDNTSAKGGCATEPCAGYSAVTHDLGEPCTRWRCRGCRWHCPLRLAVVLPRSSYASYSRPHSALSRPRSRPWEHAVASP